jgi:predicted adenylyl cyclase CyaB
MARNIEIKAHVADLNALAARTAAIADSGPVRIAQDDTFFRCDHGRLKLRVFEDGTGELIFYRRADQGGPKQSSYLLTPVTSPDALRETLALAYGQAGRVVKQRTLYLVGRTRVHLDRVAGLGDFMELEVVLADDETPEAGVREAQALMLSLGIASADLVERAYVDLLRERSGAR